MRHVNYVWHANVLPASSKLKHWIINFAIHQALYLSYSSGHQVVCFRPRSFSRLLAIRVRASTSTPVLLLNASRLITQYSKERGQLVRTMCDRSEPLHLARPLVVNQSHWEQRHLWQSPVVPVVHVSANSIVAKALLVGLRPASRIHLSWNSRWIAKNNTHTESKVMQSSHHLWLRA